MSTPEDTTRRFHIGDLLSVTTHRTVSPSGIGGLYRILNHLTGDSLMTHQLPLAADAVTPDLLEQHPWLKTVTGAESVTDEPACQAFLADVAGAYGEWHEVTAAPQAWGQHDPIADFTNQYPNTPVIAVKIPEGGDQDG